MTNKRISISLLLFSTLALFSFVKGTNDFKTLKLQSSQLFEEAQQELCPFPGFHGIYCPGQQNPTFLAYKRQLQQAMMQAMPSGIGASFDITTGELKLPAIQLTYQQNPQQESIWTDPVSHTQFVIADETRVEAVESQADVKIFRNEFDLTNIWLEATQRGQWLGGEYSSSKDLNEVFEKFFKGEQETSISQLTKNVVRLTFKSDNLKLNRFAQRAVDSLPHDYVPEVYNDFLASWGTHISVDTYLGGMIEKQTVYKDCVYATPSFTGGLSPDQVVQALNNELYGNQAEGYFVARRRVSIDHKFGGNPEDVPNWESTISQNPALLKINRFMSWDNFVADGQIKANLQQAIQSRVDLMIQRQNSYKQAIQEQRRIQRNGPKIAYSIAGCGNGFLNKRQGITIKQAFEFKESSQCPPGLNVNDSKVRCSSGEMNSFDGLLNNVRYERDDNGNYRTVVMDLTQNIQGNVQVYGNWVDRGCSIAQPPSYPQYTDFNTPPPDRSAFKIICTDCVPQVYNTPQGVTLQCSCPAF